MTFKKVTYCFLTSLKYTPIRNWSWESRLKLYPRIKTTLSSCAARSHMRCTCSKQPLRWSPRTELTSPPPPLPPPSSISDVFLCKAMCQRALKGFFFSSPFLLLFYEHGQTSKNVTNGFAREPVAEAGWLKIEGRGMGKFYGLTVTPCLSNLWPQFESCQLYPLTMLMFQLKS